MKKLLYIISFAVSFINLNGQQAYELFDTDTIKGADTLYMTADAKIRYNGFVTFSYIAQGLNAGDRATFCFQGTNNSFEDATDLFFDAYIGNTASPNTFFHNPATFLRYRVMITGNNNDTVVFSNNKFIYKR